jgi:phage terminase large subunit GpA-like protein
MYLCENCKGLISEDYKIGMLKQYEWRGGGYDKWTNLVNGHAIPRDTMARGFHMSTLYSPFYSWSEIRRDWLKARNVPSELQGFYNLTLAELYDSQDIASIVVERTIPEHPRVKDCGAGRNVECPPGSVAVTMGADVQRDRIEISAIAWGEHERGTVIDHHVCYGRTETKPSVPDSVWQKFTEYLLREFTHSDKKGMRAVAICVDTGYAKVLEHVHDWFRNLPPKLKARVILIKGDADPKDPHATLWPKQATASKESVQKWGHAVTNIRVDIGKDTVFRMLEHGLDGIESECLLFADNPVFDSEYFRGVYSEEKITNANGLDEWVQKVRKNEPLDCIVYGLAALRAWVSRGGRLRDHSGLASTRVRRHSLAGATEPDGDTWV